MKAYASADPVQTTASMIVDNFSSTDSVSYYAWATGVLVPVLVAVIGYLAIRKSRKDK